MAKKRDDLKLDDMDPDEILSELRARELGPGIAPSKGMSKRVSGLAGYDTPTLVKALREAQKVIYEIDDRDDIFNVTDPSVRSNADSVVSLVDFGDLIDNGDGTSTIRTQHFGTALGLCSSERFRDQPTAPFCSGFLVAPDIVATAGHCIDGGTLPRTRFVFGFRMKNSTEARLVVPNDDIFRGTAIIDRKLEVGNGSDYALVQLDRPATGRPITKIRRNGKIGKGEPLYVIGHPSGLPQKYAPGAKVRDSSPDAYFVANLDTYGGNSGSPVFNEKDHVVEGILVRGETDFVFDGSCRVSNVCPTTGCRGEDVTRTSEFEDLVPVRPNGEESPGISDRLANLEDAVEEIGSDIQEIKNRLS
ncbi:MAG: serine protease [Alphaproteobacteria bacterium]|nr:serine protease [Alphaproteobacteria bacterium]